MIKINQDSPQMNLSTEIERVTVQSIATENTEAFKNETFFDNFCENSFFGRKLSLIRGKVKNAIGRPLDDRDIPELLTFLEENPDVLFLNLEYNNVGDEGFEQLIDYSLLHGNILALHVSYNEIGVRGLEYLLIHGEKLNIKSIHLRGNKFGVEGSKSLALFLLNNSRILELDIADVDQDQRSLVYFTRILSSNLESCNRTLKILDISRPSTGLMDAEHFSDCIGRMLKYNSSLLGLGLQKFGLTCHDIETMMENAKYNQTLQSLDLGCNNISDRGVESISNWLLSTRPALKILNLSGNLITAEGARSLSRSIPSSKLISLDVSHNRISDDGLVPLLGSLVKSPPIRCLRVFGNPICDLSAKIIKRMLLSTVLTQENLDVRPWESDNKWYLARYDSPSWQLKYFLEASCPRHQLQLEETSPKKAAYAARNLRNTSTMDQAFPQLPELRSTESIGKKFLLDCNCCACKRSIYDAESSSREDRFDDRCYDTYCQLDDTGSNEESLTSFKSKKSECCNEKSVCSQYLSNILDSVSCELRERILGWINIEESVLAEDLETAATELQATRKHEARTYENRNNPKKCFWTEITISRILKYLEEEPANILLVQSNSHSCDRLYK